MAEKETAPSTYETQFTKDNILALKNAINKGINAHAENEIPDGKLDLFVILAALGQAVYEVVIRSFPRDDEEAKKAHDEMKILADKVIKQLDETRKDIQTKPMSELLSLAHSLSIVSEFYARRRDDYITQLTETTVPVQDEAVTESTEQE